MAFQCNIIRVYLEESHIVFSGTYSQVNVYRSAAFKHSLIIRGQAYPPPDDLKTSQRVSLNALIILNLSH